MGNRALTACSNEFISGFFGRICIRHQNEDRALPVAFLGLLQGRRRYSDLAVVPLLFESLEQGPGQYPVAQGTDHQRGVVQRQRADELGILGIAIARLASVWVAN